MTKQQLQDFPAGTVVHGPAGLSQYLVLDDPTVDPGTVRLAHVRSGAIVTLGGDEGVEVDGKGILVPLRLTSRFGPSHL